MNIAEGAVAVAPAELEARGIGSCVVLVLYDPAIQAGGMAHILLPSEDGARSHPPGFQYADTALAGLLEPLLRLGAKPSRLVAKLAGGARMFDFSEEPGATVGERNVSCLRALLKSSGIPLIGEDVGGSRGRSVRFELATGRLIVSTLGCVAHEI